MECRESGIDKFMTYVRIKLKDRLVGHNIKQLPNIDLIDTLHSPAIPVHFTLFSIQSGLKSVGQAKNGCRGKYFTYNHRSFIMRYVKYCAIEMKYV